MEIIIGILGIIISSILVFYALRVQGNYKKSEVYLYPTYPQNLDNNSDLIKYFKKNTCWLTVNSCPVSPKDGAPMVIQHPFVILNQGKLAAENIIIQIFYEMKYSIEHLETNLAYEQMGTLNNGIKRTHYQVSENRCCSVFEIPMIPGESGIPFYEYLWYDPKFLVEKKSQMDQKIFGNDAIQKTVTKFYYNVNGKNINKTDGSFFLFSCMDDKEEHFIEQNLSFIENIIKYFHEGYKKVFNRIYILPWPRKFFFWLFYRNRRITYIIAYKRIEAYGIMEPTDKKKKSFVMEYIPKTINDIAICEYVPAF